MASSQNTEHLMKPSMPASDPKAELRQKNLRLALILASVVAVFFLGFVAKVMLIGAPN